MRLINAFPEKPPPLGARSCHRPSWSVTMSDRSAYREQVRQRLNIPETNGHNIWLHDAGGLVLEGYERVVIGDRGAYIEFRDPSCQLLDGAVLVEDRPTHQHLQTTTGTKVYWQKKTKPYADYRVDAFYVAADKMFLDNGMPAIATLRSEQPTLAFD